MTLIVGVVTTKEAVLVADSLCRWVHNDVGYREPEPFPKIHRLIDPRFVVGIAGNTSGRRLLEDAKDKQAKETKNWEQVGFEEIVEDTRKKIETSFLKTDRAYGPTLDFLFAGVQNGRPELLLVHCEENGNGERKVHPIAFPNSRKVIGLEPHGAVYLLYRYFKKEMSVDEAIAISSYCINVTAEQDPNIDSRITVAVVSQDKKAQFKRVTSAGVADLEGRTQAICKILAPPLTVTGIEDTPEE